VRIFLAGGTGVLGRRIVPGLIRAGHQVTVLSRAADRADAVAALGATIAIGDALDAAAVEQAVTAAKPDLVMHQLTDLSGGSSQANAALRINGTANLVAAAQEAGVSRFVLQSIAWAYEPGDSPADEDTPLDTISADEARRMTVDAVIAMEQQAQQLSGTVVLRNGMLYGPDTWYAADGAMAAAARAQKLPADRDVTSFVYVDDAARAAVQAVDWPAGIVNIVDNDPAPGSEWLPVFADAVGAPAPAPAGGPRHPWARGADNRRSQSLGWTPTLGTWRVGMRDVLGSA